MRNKRFSSSQGATILLCCSGMKAARIMLGILLGAILLVPLIGQHLGSGIRMLEVPTAFEMQYLAISILLLPLTVLTRRRWLIGLALITVLFHASQIVPWYLGNPEAPANTAELRLVSFNVLHHNKQFSETVNWVIEQAPQVAVFQEVTPPWPEELLKLTRAFPFHYRSPDQQMDIFSKLPILDPQPIKVGDYRGCIRFQVDVGGTPVTIYASHCYPQVPLGIRGFRFHQEQLTHVMPEEIAKQADAPLVVIGDLNATMWSPHYLALVEATGLKNARQGFGVCPTLGSEKCWVWWMAVPFDQCLIRGDIGVESFATGPFLGSDHLPIVVKLRVSKETR